MIGIGERVPAAEVFRMGEAGVERFSAPELFAARKVALFGVPGAFTSTCSNIHLPGYVEGAAELRAAGIGAIICMAVNDPWVLRAWGEAHGATGVVEFLADPEGELSRALGLEADYTASGLGRRCRRFAAVLEDGRFVDLAVEPVRGVTVCGAEHVLARLKAAESEA
jgi:glutaredoxin/glutathione-dependent peroxiredoxin